MNKIFYSLLYAVSKSPLRVLYGIAWILYIVMNYLIGYRKKVITNNLKNSFPEKSDKEIRLIRKKFYKNFADYLAETLKSLSISLDELNQRHTYSNLDLFKECHDEGKNIILMAGHVFNWEWFAGLGTHVASKKSLAVYHRVKNEFWNDRINEVRSKFGTMPLDMKKTPMYMMKQYHDDHIAYLFVADQSPKKSAIHYDLHFLNQNTPVFIGYDKIAIRKNMAVIYCNTVKIKQGYYHTTFERITPDGENFQEMEIVHKYFQRLEQTIQKNPDNWLWSHKRWKYKKGIDY